MAFQRKEATIEVAKNKFENPIKISVELWDITHCMQMRIKMKGVSRSFFECGISISQFGEFYVVHSIAGICGRSLLQFVRNYVHYRGDFINLTIDEVDTIILCDDKTYKDRCNVPLKIEGIDYGFKDIQEG
jgi:hypothetical protein